MSGSYRYAELNSRFSPLSIPSIAARVQIAMLASKYDDLQATHQLDNDPSTYAPDPIFRDYATKQAVNTIKTMRPGDKVFIYHSGGESAITGLAKVASAPRPDPNSPKSCIAGFQFLKRLTPPTTLAEIKQSKLFDQWSLVRNSRLSTMPAPDEFVEWMRRRYPTAKI